jgi:exo-beta-1,3-glucanase (GH17 family)
MRRDAAAVLFLGAGLAAACASHSPVPTAGLSAVATPPREEPFVARPLHPFLGDRWIGQGISYGPHRDGQRPGGPSPTRAELRQDLELLRGRWGLLRIYSADETAADVLAIIREERLPMKVLLGAWIAPEARSGADGTSIERLPEARAANRLQVETAVRLANAYPDVVLALCVGNETQVSWSAHKLPAGTLVGWLREARRGTALPVATADDFGFWVQPESEQVARELDFLVTHIYAMWNGQPLERALDFTREKYSEVVRRHPGRPIVLGEAGWATRKHSEGDQATLIKGEPGEAQQRAFYQQFTAWVVRERVVSTWFEAFDENWKGGPHPDEVEKHWGLFRADRSPKQAMSQPPRP